MSTVRPTLTGLRGRFLAAMAEPTARDTALRVLQARLEGSKQDAAELMLNLAREFTAPPEGLDNEDPDFDPSAYWADVMTIRAMALVAACFHVADFSRALIREIEDKGGTVHLEGFLRSTDPERGDAAPEDGAAS